MKKHISLLLAAVLLLSLLAGCAGNPDVQSTGGQPVQETRVLPDTGSIVPAADFAGGSGTEADPYQIGDAAQLALMAQKVSEDTSFASAHYILTGDIALNDTTGLESWAQAAPAYGWEPIGRTGNSFRGVFDGNGHSVSGMYINTDAALSENHYERCYGLFGDVEGTVKNLNVTGSYIHVSGSSGYVGGIAGQLSAESAQIENCTGDVSILCGSMDCGGIVGNALFGSVKDCAFDGTIDSDSSESLANAGGILGSGSEVTVSGCVNRGQIQNVNAAGGIVGWLRSGTVSGCTNEGTAGGSTAGGIAGNLYLGDGANENERLTVTDCVNAGEVSGTVLAGGIAGSVSNDSGSCALTVSGCENRGQVRCDAEVAGIIGKLTADRSGGITVEGCVNLSDITGSGKTGGIICEFLGGALHMNGAVTIRDCRNSGNITSSDMYSAGIVTYWLLMGETDLQAAIEGCVNTGAITSQNYAGGILCFTDSTTASSISEGTTITIQNCENSGTVTGLSSNSFAGGIAANLGMENVQTLLSDCVNSGEVRLDFTLTEEQIQDTLSGGTFTLSQMVGGIVGRVGDGLLLTTDSDQADAANVNAPEAPILIENCTSSGALTLPDHTEHLDPNGNQVWKNYAGGIIGNCSAEDGFAFRVENCSYENADRGLGNTEYPDVA